MNTSAARISQDDSQVFPGFEKLKRKPEWYSKNAASDMEKKAFPGFFDPVAGSEAAYLEVRNFMIEAYEKQPTGYLSFTACRRALQGDAAELLSLFTFLEQHKLINAKQPSAKVTPVPLSHLTRAEVIGDALDSEVLSASSQPILGNRRALGNFAQAENCDHCGEPLVGIYFSAPGHCLCARCYQKGEFGASLSASSYTRRRAVQSQPAALQGSWTEDEEMRLLEALHTYGISNWDKVSQAVGTRDKSQCLLYFARLPIQEPYFEHSLQQMKATKVLSPFSQSTNPVMAMVTFLASSLDPALAQVAAQAAKSAILENVASHKEDEKPAIDEETLDIWSVVAEGGDKAEEEEDPIMGNMAMQAAAAAALGAAAVRSASEAEKVRKEADQVLRHAITGVMDRIEKKLERVSQIEEVLQRDAKMLQGTHKLST